VFPLWGLHSPILIRLCLGPLRIRAAYAKGEVIHVGKAKPGSTDYRWSGLAGNLGERGLTTPI
jgi:hypothetical protein